MEATPPTWQESLQAASARPLGPFFERPNRFGVDSAWYGHVPFARWFVQALRPRLLVELGTHAGVSYAAFCDAVLAGRLGTRCLAIDTWQGDAHAGFYDEVVFQELERFNRAHYASFSCLLRCSFDAALGSIADGSIDLLHIDGRHRYEDVHHDYESWLPKLSERGVVLFHDTAVRNGDFGVWRFWAELRNAHPGFEFGHAHGLGVLAPGKIVPQAVTALIGLKGQEADILRDRIALLGERWEVGFDVVRLQREVNASKRREVELREFGETTHARLAHILPRYEVAEAARRALQIQLAEAKIAAITHERSHTEDLREHAALRQALQQQLEDTRALHAEAMAAQRQADAQASALALHEAHLVDADLRRQLAATSAHLATTAARAATLEQTLGTMQA